MTIMWIAAAFSFQETPPAIVVPAAPPPPNMEWAVGLSVPELKRAIGGMGKFTPVVNPEGDRSGYVDYVMKDCTVSFSLRLSDHNQPVVDDILAERDRRPLSYPAAESCFAATLPGRRRH